MCAFIIECDLLIMLSHEKYRIFVGVDFFYIFVSVTGQTDCVNCIFEPHRTKQKGNSISRGGGMKKLFSRLLINFYKEVLIRI